MARSQQFKQRLSIVGPPLALVAVGIVVYIAVVRLGQPTTQTVKAVPQTSQSSTLSSSPSADASAIDLIIARPTQDEVVAWQKAADAGQDGWRLDPLESAKRLGLEYGFATNDTMSLSQSSASASSKTKQIEANHQGKTYLLTMYQPGVSGAKGVWAVESIAESN